MLASLVSIAAIAPISGCGAGRSSKADSLRIGIAMYNQDDTFISLILQSLERRILDAESSNGVKINLTTADGEGNQTVQLGQIDRFLEQGCDVLLVNIVDRTAVAVLIDKAMAVGTPIIFYNRQPVEEDIERWNEVYYVGARAEDSGVLQGRIALEAWTDSSLGTDKNGDGVLQYVMLEGEPGHQDALLRTQHSISELTEAGVKVEKLASDTANWTRGQAAAIMTFWLMEHGEAIEAIFANNDDMALGAIDALKEAGYGIPEIPLVVGVDASPPALDAISEGTLYGTVSNPFDAIAAAMLSMSVAVKGGAPIREAARIEQGHYVWLPYEAVTAANIEDFR